jgi:hypothetical protein
MAMMLMTTSNSIKVNACLSVRVRVAGGFVISMDRRLERIRLS